MKIVHLEAGRHLYGGARQAGYLVAALSELGIDNVLVVRRGHALAGRCAGARVIEWPLAGGDLDPTLHARLTRLLQTERPDLLHVHSRRGVDTFGGRAARSVGLPAVLTRRVQSREPAVWVRFKCRGYAAVAAISEAVLAELGASGIGDERLTLIPSAVDTSLFRPDPEARARLIERYDLPEDALIAGSAAQFIARKGQAVLLPLAGRLAAQTGRFRLLLFGRGPLRGRLESAAAAAGLGDHAVFCGYVDDFPRLLPGLDLLLHPARREGLGAVVLEAMSAGVAVVASNVGGLADVIDDGVDGRLLPAADAALWERVVLELLGNPAARRRLAENARRTIGARFTIERMTEAYLALYRQVLADAGR